MQIIDTDGKVLFEDESETIRETVEYATKIRANLKGANFEKADLQGAHLPGAILDHTNLTGARLDYARLDKASLYDACLDYASLEGANLQGVYLDKARLWRTKITESQIPDIITGLGLTVSKDGAENEE